ncbi:IS630 family transposase [Orientia tsutsugamushi]|uniref:transposase n=1 Tax=Orientia tsutsugamushi TaxID=784 RepID=UPI0005F9643E|nr:transposase [Orientia tsutsugamushi]KJV75499.1 DDE superendonuclease family protein [Orientia tsutsugamushi str. TA763]SPP23650.1 IS630 family transposase [Orientia tsutsugamushi]
MHPSKRINGIGAFTRKYLLTVSIFDCNVNTAILHCWIEQDLIPKLPNNSVIVIDNASFYKSKHLKIMIKEDGYILEYLLSYSSDLNIRPLSKLVNVVQNYKCQRSN